MTRAVAFSLLLACAGVLLGDSPDSRGPSRDSRSLLQDLVQMTNDGLSDETILVYAKAHRLELPPEVSRADLVWLRKSGVGEPVIRYMAAIDVRAADGSAPEDEADDVREGARYSSADSYSDGDRGAYGDDRDRDYESDADGGYGSYPETYYNGDYPDYGAGYAGYYPYPGYFFFSDFGRFGRFRGRGRGFVGHRGRGFNHDDVWRQRSPRGDLGRGLGRRRGSVIVDHRGPGRQESWRGSTSQGFRGQRAGVIGRAPVERAFPRGGFRPGPRGPRGAVVHNGASGRPGFSGGGRAGGFGRPGFAGGGHAGGGVSRGPVARSGGSRGAVGGRGRR